MLLYIASDRPKGTVKSTSEHSTGSSFGPLFSTCAIPLSCPHLPRLCHSPSVTRRNIFPIWALGLYRRLVLQGLTRDTSSGDVWVCAVSDRYKRSK